MALGLAALGMALPGTALGADAASLGTYCDGASARLLYRYLAGSPSWPWRISADPEATVRIGLWTPEAPWAAAYRPLAVAARRDGRPARFTEVSRRGAPPGPAVPVRDLAGAGADGRLLPSAEDGVLGVLFGRVGRVLVPEDAVAAACRREPRTCRELELRPRPEVRYGVYLRHGLAFDPGLVPHLERLGDSPQGDRLVRTLGADWLTRPEAP